MQRAALLSVSDRTGIVEFARGLSSLGFVLLTTSGTGKALKEAGLDYVAIESYTGQEEILDGRVKTLHPKIHAGLLARRDLSAHMAEIESRGIYSIDVVAVNLYPFLKYVDSDKANLPKEMVELIDVGGPAMLRASAKNFSGVYVVIDPADYSQVLSNLNNETAQTLEFRRELAQKVFSTTANYDLQIAKYISSLSAGQGQLGRQQQLGTRIDPVAGEVLLKRQELRYGENPHQRAAYYRSFAQEDCGWKLLSGKELSYNNLLDLEASLSLLGLFSDNQPFAAIIKHLNPCGAARGTTLLDALGRAKKSDPRSHFGGIIVLNSAVDENVATEIREDFAEIVVAPSFTERALSVLKTSKNLRIIEVAANESQTLEWRSLAGGVVCQEKDPRVAPAQAAKLVAGRGLSEASLSDLDLAWKLCARTKSNAITLVKNGTLIGSGAGQMSRIDSVELALSKAQRHGHDTVGAVAASDAFFPFADNVETLAKAGVVAVIAPGGAKKDPEVIDCANKNGIALYFADERHFFH